MQSSRYLAILTIVLLFSPSAAAAAPGLAAPVYPGSVAADHAGDQYQRIFYSRDPVEKVTAFYGGRLAGLEELKPGQESYQMELGGQRTRTYRYVLHRVVALEKAAVHPDRVAVEISALTDRPPAGAPAGMSVPPDLAQADSRCRPPSDFFEPLFNTIAAGKNRDWQRFNAVCERFHHLSRSIFFPSGEQDERGRTLNQAQALIRQYHAQNSPAVADDASLEDLAARMQALAMAGRMAEAQALAQQMASGVRRAPGVPGAADWDDWVGLLEKIDRHAYRTRIMINTDPATWPDRIRLRDAQ
jgi:hypothetical protein